MQVTAPQDIATIAPTLAERLRKGVYDTFEGTYPNGYEGGLLSLARRVGRRLNVDHLEVLRQLNDDKVLVQKPSGAARLQANYWRVELAS